MNSAKLAQAAIDELENFQFKDPLTDHSHQIVGRILLKMKSESDYPRTWELMCLAIKDQAYEQAKALCTLL